MIKARIKLTTGELVTKEFESKAELFNFIKAGGHELIRWLYK